MKNIFTARLLLLILISSLISSTSKAQTPKAKTILELAPGINAPITYPNNINPNRVTPCDNPDVRIFPSNRPQSEIHLSINKQNPQVILLSAQTFPFFNSWQGAYWSTDGGINWNGSDDLPNGAFGRGDPSTAFDAAGNGYVATMNAATLFANDANGYLVQRTNNNGAVWQPQIAGTGVLNNFDKEMIAADDVPTSPFANNLYCSWSILVQNPANNLVQFNRSTDQGNNFSAPITLKTGWGQGTNVQTGPNGQVYVCLADYNNSATDWTSKGLGFSRSTDGGLNFTASQRVISYTGIRTYNSNTQNDQNPLFHDTRVNDFPSMAVDKSNSLHRGRIYVVFPVKENGNGKAVIQISFSDNQGTTWSTPSTISIPNGRQNWFPWIAVDDTNGDIYVAYYSFDEATGFNTNTYVAVSNDGGATFINQRVSDVNHVTSAIAEFGGGYAGDYIGITAHSGRAFASWMDNRTGQWQVYVSEVRNMDIIGDDAFCNTSNNYTITNLPQGATIQWQVTPSSVATPDCPTCPQTTLTKQANGIITLSAVITSNCGGQITVPKGNIFVGSPTPTIQYVTYYGNEVGLTALLVPDATYNWYEGGVLMESGSDNHYITFVECNSSKFIQVEETNVCGTSLKAGKGVSVRCSGSYTLVPNPANSSLTISVSEDKNTNSSTAQITEVKVLDQSGNLKTTAKYPKGTKQVTVNISSFKEGIFIVQIFNGAQWSNQQLLIQH